MAKLTLPMAADSSTREIYGNVIIGKIKDEIVKRLFSRKFLLMDPLPMFESHFLFFVFFIYFFNAGSLTVPSAKTLMTLSASCAGASPDVTIIAVFSFIFSVRKGLSMLIRLNLNRAYRYGWKTGQAHAAVRPDFF